MKFVCSFFSTNSKVFYCILLYNHLYDIIFIHKGAYKVKRVLILLMTVFLLAACGSVYDDLVSEANEAMEQEDYKNAKKLLELALAEEPSGKDANDMLGLLEGYDELLDLQAAGEWEKAFDRSNNLLKNNAIPAPLKKELKEILANVEEMKDEEEEILVEIKAITKLLQQNNVDDAYKKIDLLDRDFTSAKVTEAFDAMEDALQDAEKRVSEKEELELAAKEKEARQEAEKKAQAAASQSQSQYDRYIEKASNLDSRTGYADDGAYYTEWDNLLNEVWGALRNTMDSSSFEALRKRQNEWIKEKDGRYNNGKSNGNEAAAKDRLMSDTKERTYYLINNYMN